MNGKNPTIFSGLGMLQKNIQLLKKVNKNTLIEKMLGMKVNKDKQMKVNGEKMPQKNIQ